MESSDEKKEIRLQGIGVSPGIARAMIHFVGGDFEQPDTRHIGDAEVAQEKERFRIAITRTREQIREMQVEIDSTVGGDHAGIFDAHLLVLEDNAVIDEVIRVLESEKRNVDRIYHDVIYRYLDSLKKIADPYLRERAIDIEDVARRVLRNLRWPDGRGGEYHFSEPCIVGAHDLTPSDTMAMDRSKVLAFATEMGSVTSHTAIMARSLNIPAVVGLHHLHDKVSQGEEVLLDGYHGLLIIRPTEQTLEDYRKISEREVELQRELETLREAETRTADGMRVTLSANIEFISELPYVKEQGAEGIGLYRTEFFYLNEIELRSEDRQAENYAEAARSVSPHGVIVRTLDIGGDKLMPDPHEEPEPNPFLGWRGIRVSISHPELFKVQLRAILRASAAGKVGVMYPFISSMEELKRANELLDEAKQELSRAGAAFDDQIEVGVMIEIPSAALMAHALAKEVDFFSIGTNDLVQYTIAVDRVNDRVADLYQPNHPAVVELIRHTVEAAHENEIWAGVCGEVAGDVISAPLLLGTGVDELSVGAAQLLRVRRAISRLDSDECRALLEEVSGMTSHGEIRKRCREMAMEKYPELID